MLGESQIQETWTKSADSGPTADASSLLRQDFRIFIAGATSFLLRLMVLHGGSEDLRIVVSPAAGKLGIAQGACSMITWKGLSFV